MLVFKNRIPQHWAMMRKRSFGFLLSLLSLAALFVANPDRAAAQVGGSNLQYQVANLMEDVRLLDERLRQMSVQLEDMRRENERMRQLVNDYSAQADRNLSKFATIGQLNEAIRTAAAKLESRDDEINRKTLAEVGRTIDEFAKRVETALKGVTPPRANPPPKVFDKTGIPKTGTPYVIQSGDTISSVAQKLNSRVDWILNINEIADARLVQVGQTIFVPQQGE